MTSSDDLTDAQRLRWMELALRHCPDGVVLTDEDAHILYVNEAWEQITGWSREEAIGRTVRERIRSGQHPPEFWDRIRDDLAAGKVWRGRIESRRRDGSKLVQDATLIPVRQASGEVMHISMRRDMTSQLREQAEQSARMQQLSMQDSLTGLPNRALLYDRMEQARARHAHSSSRRYALIFFDIDRFRIINDTLGTAKSDRLLVQVGERLRRALRSSDTVARLSGDEFAALVEDPVDGHLGAARRLHAEFDAPFELDGERLTVRVSCGLALGRPEVTPRDVLRNAERAMYRAKQDGGGRLVAFSPEMATFFADRLQREQSLRRALEHDELTAWFQPQVRLRDTMVVGYEALVRWPSAPDRNPGEFVPLAEQTGQIRTLGQAVLEQACRFATRMPQARIAFNLSSLQLDQSETFDDIDGALRRHQLESQRLEIEITETAAMRDADRSIALCERFRQRGLQLAVDDFGTGYSSLAQLHRLPVQRLKIDRSFVAGLGEDGGSLAIVRSILGLARALGLETVAEGIETTAQLRVLQREGCELGQGWLFSRALPPEEAGALWGRSLGTSGD